MAKATLNIDVPTFDGQPIFGDLASFSVVPVAVGMAGGAAAVDAFLGLTPGTALYGPDPGTGRLWGVTGALIAPTSDGVAAMRTTLLSFAGLTSRFNAPTGLPFPSDYVYNNSCEFVASEFVPAGVGIVQVNGGVWSLSYSLIIRQLVGGLGP